MFAIVLQMFVSQRETDLCGPFCLPSYALQGTVMGRAGVGPFFCGPGAEEKAKLALGI